MSAQTLFLNATPVLASLDIEKSVAFYCGQLGFTKVYAEAGVYGIISRGEVALHFWACQDPAIADTSCRIGVAGIESL